MKGLIYLKWKYYIAAVFSNIALLLYSLPWTYGATHSALGFYIIAFLWFIFAWIALIVHIFKYIKMKRNNNPDWKHHLIASILIVVSYIGLFLIISNGYMVTV